MRAIRHEDNKGDYQGGKKTNKEGVHEEIRGEG